MPPRRTWSRACRVAVPIFCLAWAASARPADAAGPATPRLGLGHEYDLGGEREEFLLPDPLIDNSIAPDHPLYVRIRAPWSLLEPQAGSYDWSEVDRIVGPYRAANYVVTLCLYGANRAVDPAGKPPSAAHPAVLKAWLEFLRAAALHFKGQVRTYEVWDAPNRESEWPADRVADFAYMLKNSSVTLRSADPGAWIAQGALALSGDKKEADLAWQRALYAQDVATYVDILPVHPSSGGPLAPLMSAAYDVLLQSDPSAQLWAVAVPVEGESDRARAADLMTKFIEGQGEGAAVVSFDLEADVEGRPEFPGVLLDIHKLFLPTYARITGGGVSFRGVEGQDQKPLEGITAYAFFDADAFQGLVGFRASSPSAAGKARMILNTAAVRAVVVYDIVGGAAGPVPDARPDFKTNTTDVPVAVFTRPLVLQFARVPIKGFEAEKEQLQIKETGLITAEEVMAGHQTFMADQRYRLKHYRADALTSYHLKIAGSNTIDISYDSAYFWDPAVGAEWEHRAFYYNGVRWTQKKEPEIPIPEPEKVFTLPLDINLNKDYTYEYVGRDKVGEYDCHVVDFKPIDPHRTLYEGRVWIETRTFAPVKFSTVQLNLAPPVVSNHEQSFFAPVAGPDGSTYWVVTKVESQRIMAVAGENLVLLIETGFTNLQINDPEFEAAREQAYRSERSMLRDTDKGLKYLERTESGERVVKEGSRTSALLALGGLYRQPGLEYPVLPLAGAAYFNYDVGGRKTQVTALIGGVVNLFSYTDPHVFGKKIDATAQATLLAVNVTDQLFVRGREQPESNVDTRFQSFSGALGAPLGNFMRLKATYSLDYANYSLDNDTKTFVTPSDTFIQSPGLAWEFNRAAWTLTASAHKSFRSKWEAWGDETLPCPSPGSCLADFDSADKNYVTYEWSVAKQFFLPMFQKLRFEGVWQSGSHLDRFGEYQFSFFGNRLRGFSGSGVRYDRGAIARAQYAFNIADVVRFEASLDHAYVRDSLTSDEFNRFTGFGVSGNTMGPWGTVLQFDIGVAVASDFEGLRGKSEFQIGLLKYF